MTTNLCRSGHCITRRMLNKLTVYQGGRRMALTQVSLCLTRVDALTYGLQFCTMPFLKRRQSRIVKYEGSTHVLYRRLEGISWAPGVYHQIGYMSSPSWNETIRSGFGSQINSTYLSASLYWTNVNFGINKDRTSYRERQMWTSSRPCETAPLSDVISSDGLWPEPLVKTPV